ncbi:leader peptidase (prepilin peptidase)/N-methyltransferase [Neobacillus bataviensis]|uniref:Leader peptidase (Prepilin peptidase)/N-methyltransferase n=1 Tax=Neobacillus bataviensis TaxID=220685 RepID=A0A561DGN9_9BACI|nr:A24 family peptidase [Neobacillus bataviensis]TWE02556.1 leader peptidase (prepilin peptidase)/N-methyltransferase [Neobacillus bataviensis]
MTILLFIYGLILGSFFNVVGLRVPLKQSIVTPRSACPNCGHQLTPFELIPVLSYMLQKGKCRGCQSRISPIYPTFELLTGILFVLAPYVIGWSGELIVALTFITMFIIITVSDIHYMIIPDKILIWFAGIFLLERMIWPLTPWWDSLLGAVTGFLLLLTIAVVSKGMGFGDVKLYALIGFVIGFKLVLLSFFLATLYGAVIGGLALLFRIVKKRQPIPFGPFIAAGTMTAYFWGWDIIDFYFNHLLRIFY